MTTTNQKLKISMPRSAVFRAWKLAWEAKTETRRRDAWWLCWHLAVRAGWRASGPGGVYIPHGKPGAGLWLLPPGSPCRSAGSL